MTPAGMVYNGKCAKDQAQRRGVKRSAGPYTGLFYPHLRATELGMRVESVLNIDAPQIALHSPGPQIGVHQCSKLTPPASPVLLP